ncbi:MAG: hypothetical protein G01um101466_358 [Parcubacteria group bacterium Gr01-1014_66]|nr:MAG: hypothetical protein G01um101466_358 [Parcubacteria group bacterium Gr01-1014_66]
MFCVKKQIFISTILVTILSIFFTPTTLYAIPILPVPTAATTNTLLNPTAFTSTDYLEKYVLKPAVHSTLRAVLFAATQQVVDWVQKDGGRNVGFVGNLEQAVRREADIRGGEFLNNLTGINWCGDIGLFLRLSLSTPGFAREAACTLTDIVSNVEDFYLDFTNGGWAAFMQIATRPQNNPAGAYLMALDAKISSENQRVRAFSDQLQKSFPFKGFVERKEVCDPLPISSTPGGGLSQGGLSLPIGGTAGSFEAFNNPSPSQARLENPTGNCRTEEITRTPGQVVEKALGDALGSGKDYLVNAKDIDEALSAIMTALVDRLLQETVAGGRGFIGSDTTYDNIYPQERDRGGVASRPALLKTTTDGINEVYLLIDTVSSRLLLDRRELFALRAQNQTTAAPPSPATLRQGQLKNEISEFLRARYQFLTYASNLTKIYETSLSAVSQSETQRLSQQISEHLRLVRALARTHNLLIPTPITATGDPGYDVQRLGRAGDQDAVSFITLINETQQEVNRTANAPNTGLNRAKTDLEDTRATLNAALSNLDNAGGDAERLGNAINSLIVLRTELIESAIEGVSNMIRADQQLGIFTGALPLRPSLAVPEPGTSILFSPQ